MDLIHKATKLIDHNRGAVAGILVLGACILAAGCSAWDGKTVSSSTGNVVDAQERRAEYVQDTGSLKLRARAAEAKVAEGMRELEAVQADADEVEADYDADLDTIRAEVDARKAGIGQIGEAVAQAVPGASWVLPWLTIGTGALAGGVVVDNRRKDRVIVNQKKSDISAAA